MDSLAHTHTHASTHTQTHQGRLKHLGRMHFLREWAARHGVRPVVLSALSLLLYVCWLVLVTFLSTVVAVGARGLQGRFGGSSMSPLLSDLGPR